MVEFFLNVPIASKATVVGIAVGPIGLTLVLVPTGRGVNVGVGGVAVGFGVRLGEPDAVKVGVKVAVGGAPFESVIASIAKPGPGVGEVDEPLLPPQLNINAPATNNRTGATTSHLSRHDKFIE